MNAARQAHWRTSRQWHPALMRKRGELLERGFAHELDTGGMRRTHLRGHENILKRLLIHVGGFNLGLLMRKLIGKGTPRGLQDRCAVALALFWRLWTLLGAFSGRLARFLGQGRIKVALRDYRYATAAV